MKTDRSFVISIVAIGIALFAVLIAYVGEGNVRQVDIYLPEQIIQTIAFQGDGMVGIKGIGETNPTLVTRSGDFAYVLTVRNEGDSPHQFYIEGLDVQTNLLMPGEEETITVFPEKPGTYSYYDKAEGQVRLGELKVVQVVPRDAFEGQD